MSENSEFLSKIQQEVSEVTCAGLIEAKSLGADGARILASNSIQSKLVIEANEITLANTTNDLSIAISFIKDQKKGSAATNNATPAAVSSMIKKAAELANFSLADPYLGLPDRKSAPEAKPLSFLYDDNIAALEPASLKDLMFEVLDLIKSDERVVLDRLEMGVELEAFILQNSLGVNQQQRQSSVFWEISGMAREASEVSGFDYDEGFSYTADGFKKQVIDDVKKFMQKIVANLNPRKAPSYQGKVILSPRAVDDILLECWLYHASGHQVMDDKSRWRDKIGKAVVSPLVNLTDDPHNFLLAGASSYDSDGLPTAKSEIIKDGVLCRHLHNFYSAARLGVPANGMGGGPFGIRFEKGSESLKSILSVQPEILFVDRFSGNVDPLTGDFSGVAKSSRLYVHAVEAGAVVETMISGNVFELSQNILAVSKEEERVSCELFAPIILVDSVSVSGASEDY